MRKLGQHFLRNESVALAAARALAPHTPRTIIEIGPGHGELTHALRRAHPEAAIVAIERDPILAAALRSRGIEAPLNIIEGDALKLLKKVVLELPPDEPYCVAGNIPYYITGHLLRTVGALDPRPRAAVFMVQREVAERAASGTGHMNRLAASIQMWAKPKIIAAVPRSAFSPPPNVDSAVLLLETKSEALSARSVPWDHAIKVLFAQPRKTLFNNLRAAMTEQEAATLLAAIGLDHRARPADLSVGQIAELSPRIPHPQVLE